MNVRVPASSANLGPGFDALGLALELHAEIGLVDSSTGSAERSKQVDEHHPASIAFVAAGGKGPLWVRSPIPIGRGLGFSGAMRVGGAAVAMVQRVGVQALVERHADVLAIAAGLEGHADNVAASLYGGVVVTDGTKAVGVETPLQPDVVLWIPEDTTSTSASRTALPAVVPFDDAVFNVARTAMLVAALAAGDTDALAAATQDRLRQLQQQRREIEDYIARGSNMTVANSVPAFVYLALGSAYFRTEQFPDAEREYRAAIAVEPKSGEAFNNLAALYLQTGRYKEADEAVKSAERAGFRVHPQLKQDIKDKLDK